MDGKVLNPFTPSFGRMPFALAGRTDYIDDVMGGLANIPGDPNRSTVFVGPRGSGKTVLLSAIAELAGQQGWVHVSLSAREGMLDEAISQLRTNAGYLLKSESRSDITTLKAGPLGFSRTMRYGAPATFRTSMTNLVAQINDQGSGVLVTVDEANPSCGDFIEIIDVYQHLVTENRDVSLLIAGLPHMVSVLLLDQGVSFIRRAFQRPLHAIPKADVEYALLQTIEANGRHIDPAALDIVADAAGGFAFAIQLVGYYLWREGSDDRNLNVEDARQAVRYTQREMERSVFIPTLRDLRPREVQYLHAMALDDGPSTTSDIAQRLGISMTNASNLRRRLIEYGAIADVRMGQVEFEMPLLKEYLRTHPDAS